MKLIKKLLDILIIQILRHPFIRNQTKVITEILQQLITRILQKLRFMITLGRHIPKLASDFSWLEKTVRGQHQAYALAVELLPFRKSF